MTGRNINREIIEDLYTQALLLSDDVRAAFDLRLQSNAANGDDVTRVALSIEGLRTTTRLMHLLAWLLNQRAHMAGELSDKQLEHFCALPEEREADAENLARLEAPICALIAESERLHARVARLDRHWREKIAGDMPVASLQGRIARAFASG